MVTENPQEEILLPPEYAILIFGDGHIALTQGGRETEDEKGREVIEFLIKPSSNLKKRYKIKEEQLNRNGAMLFPVLRGDLIPLNMYDDANRRWLYIKTFDHKETSIGNINWDLRRKLEDSKMRITFLEGNLIYMSEQLQLAKTNPAEFVTQGTEVFNKMASSVVDLMRAKKGKMEEED